MARQVFAFAGAGHRSLTLSAERFRNPKGKTVAFVGEVRVPCFLAPPTKIREEPFNLDSLWSNLDVRDGVWANRSGVNLSGMKNS